MILIDTSVWIDHLRSADQRVIDQLERTNVLMHPFVLGEIACGNLSNNRRAILQLLSHLPFAPVATDKEVLRFIDRHVLMGKGIGYVDAHLLASVTLTGSARIWTRDKRLAAIAKGLDLAV